MMSSVLCQHQIEEIFEFEGLAMMVVDVVDETHQKDVYSYLFIGKIQT